jgi:hypothetical protein
LESEASENDLINEKEFAMKDKRKAYEEKLEAQFEEWNAQIALLKADKAWDEVVAAYHNATSKFK